MSAFVDPQLRAEIAHPGSDQRIGVNIVAVPSDRFVSAIQKLQKQLEPRAPGQYFYPPQDLHLTVVEIRSAVDAEQAALLFEKLAGTSAELFRGLAAFTLQPAQLRIDDRAGAVVFEMCPALHALRSAIAQRLRSIGVTAEPRYVSESTHMTLMRYLVPIDGEFEAWRRQAESLGVDALLTWTVTELWLATGATWYGMRSRITRVGPYGLGAER